MVETPGGEGAFNGGFAVALSEHKDIVQTTRFACVVAGISVTRKGTAPSMPFRTEVRCPANLSTQPLNDSKYNKQRVRIASTANQWE